MIKSLRIEDAARSCIPWWGDVAFLQEKDSIDFKPGLNILWGPNGSGKSTVIKALARMLHCEQGGTQLVTSTSMGEVVNRNASTYQDGVHPLHDGQPVAYFDPTNAVGLIGGAFDWDFGDMGLRNTMYKGSHGQTTLMRGESAILPIVKGTPPPAVTWKQGAPSSEAPGKRAGESEDSYQKYTLERWKRHRAMVDTLKGTEEDSGRFTCLLDEPDRSLDIPLQFRFWLKFAEAALFHKVQIIAASHSVFALDLPGAHYIEFKEGYLDSCRRSMKAHSATYLDEMIAEREERRAPKTEPEAPAEPIG